MGIHSSSRMAEYTESVPKAKRDFDLKTCSQSLNTNQSVNFTPGSEYLCPEVPCNLNTTRLYKSAYFTLTKQACGLRRLERKHFLKNHNLAVMLSNRESGIYANNNFPLAERCKIGNQYIPNKVNRIDFYGGKVFCGIFSKDGERFMTASQDRYIRFYNASQDDYKLINSIRARDVGWSIIDIAFSPNRKHVVYATWSSALHLCPIDGNGDNQQPLSLFNTARRFCVFSVVFSSNGRELLCGANDGCLYIYDLQRHDKTLKVPAHEYDVNSVAFANDTSQIIFSGGDDGLLKVWDRRTMDESKSKPVGILAGHVDGVTFIDSRNDGRHLISNSKDQSIKLWDIRVFSSERTAKKTMRIVDEQNWDYRWQEVPPNLIAPPKLVGDTSLMTFRGHVVVKTLLRCRFSPQDSTGQRFIYTGCGSGSLVMYDTLTGKKALNIVGHKQCVRDVAWHPNRNEILTCSWDATVGLWMYKRKDLLDNFYG